MKLPTRMIGFTCAVGRNRMEPCFRDVLWSPGTELETITEPPSKFLKKADLALEYLRARNLNRKPLGAINLRKLLDDSRPWRPLQRELVAAHAGGITISVESPNFDDFATCLLQVPQ